METPNVDVMEGRANPPPTELARDTSLWSDWSIEATLPSDKDLDFIAERLPPNGRVYLSALPKVPYADQLRTAARLKATGIEPVPHISARKLRSEQDLADYLQQARDAGVERALVIAGDLNRPLGPFGASADVIETDLFLRAGFKEVGIAGYPEGHPLIDQKTIDAHLDRKINVLRGADISVEIVSQFCFDSASILAWCERLRRRGVVYPIRIGLAGPAKASTLLKFALRCGVNLPLRHTNTAARLLRGTGVAEMVTNLDTAIAETDAGHRHALHFYTFGGITQTVTWAKQTAAAAAGA